MSVSSQATPSYWALIPAAGLGRRFGGETPKQYQQILGRSLLEWSLAPFLALPWIRGVMVVLNAEDSTFASLPVSSNAKIATTTGAGQRHESVLAGLRALSSLESKAEQVFVMVHDAARPCVAIEDIERLKREGSDDHGGLLAEPVSDTLKRAEAGQAISSIDRRQVWRAQTPQMFRLDLLRTALEDCGEQMVTDDASAMEQSGYRPRLVQGSGRNLKVTYADDLAVAALWLKHRQAVKGT